MNTNNNNNEENDNNNINILDIEELTKKIDIPNYEGETSILMSKKVVDSIKQTRKRKIIEIEEEEETEEEEPEYKVKQLKVVNKLKSKPKPNIQSKSKSKIQSKVNIIKKPNIRFVNNRKIFSVVNKNRPLLIINVQEVAIVKYLEEKDKYLIVLKSGGSELVSLNTLSANQLLKDIIKL